MNIGWPARLHKTRLHFVTGKGGTGKSTIAAALALALAAGVVAPGHVYAQNQPAQALPKITLTAGRSTVLTMDFDVTRIAVTNPAIADAVVVEPREVLIDGKAPGTISLIIWGEGQRLQYDLSVEQPVTTLQQQLSSLFPGEDIVVSATDEAIILSGSVSNNGVSLRAAEIAQASSSKVKVINMLQLPSGQESQQVMLQVRFWPGAAP